MNENHRYRQEIVDRGGLGLFNSSDSDNIVVRIVKGFFYCVFLWMFNVYSCFFFVAKKQYRSVNHFAF